MRALCGAIITAGALIGLGLVTIGSGTRFQYWNERYSADHPKVVAGNYKAGDLMHPWFAQLDTASMISFVFLILAALIGLGIAFFGLALHHERRKLEMMREYGDYPSTRNPSAPATTHRVPSV